MIAHILKLIWNQRKHYTGIFIEQVLVFIILTICILSFSEKVRLYLSPGNLNTENTIIFWLNNTNDHSPEEVGEKIQSLVSKMRQKYPSSIISYGDLTPYLNGGQFTKRDSVVVDNRKILTKIYRSDKNGLAVYQPQIEEGEWFSGNFPEDGSLPLIVSRQFLEESGLKHPIGKKIQYGNYTYTVTGVISGIKNNPFTPSTPTIVLPINDKQDASFGGFDVKIIDSDIDTYVQDLYKEFRKEFPDPLDTPTIDRIEQWKIGEILETIISVSLQAIPTLFLLVFAFIGTFGLFWVHSRKRKSEYALRMAIGSTRFRMIYLVIMESLVITCLAMLPGLILFCYISDFTPGNLFTMGITVCIMLTFALFSAWYPAYTVSQINPAETLHYE
ncbi:MULTISPECIES: ABC transporter permease [Sanguibacteroides]|uniref:Uncharacterized protein n=1 Tax=Sanguibacteroides justesenii TaxID=1547597 RepID=A0A0C3R6U8_9PORP|nr:MULTISPECIES: ABC transporter permease [Sanguibacteroides]KIO43626.1 hypothetical protein IE90_10935 [Sanguibacteroides justesenii]KIO45790.1 hypothetical protein BA92_04875 [Sanguibacteroides justesenii]PXZ45123.1 ABC transporter permease [Sanguibacteroides justesenii]